MTKATQYTQYGNIPILRQQKDWVDGLGKWPNFADLHYYIYAGIVVGYKKSKILLT